MGQRRNLKGNNKSTELNVYENITYQETGHAAKAVLRGKFIVLKCLH